MCMIIYILDSFIYALYVLLLYVMDLSRLLVKR